MENEIELKIMLSQQNIPLLKAWLHSLNPLVHQIDHLGNTYFDTPEHFFAREKMGLRVRSHNQSYELTLKMKGNIIGGLHIRPEYNLPLPNNLPDFKRLVSHYHLPIAHAEQIDAQLHALFSTDFVREKWLIAYRHSQIEIALDQGNIKNRFGEEAICEVEFELKQGQVADIFILLNTMPKADGMWFSGLSKAQRGYLVGQQDNIAKEIEKLTACKVESLSDHERYAFTQHVADFLRLSPEHPQLTTMFCRLENIEHTQLPSFLTSKTYLERNLAILQSML